MIFIHIFFPPHWIRFPCPTRKRSCLNANLCWARPGVRACLVVTPLSFPADTESGLLSGEKTVRVTQSYGRSWKFTSTHPDGPFYIRHRRRVVSVHKVIFLVKFAFKYFFFHMHGFILQSFHRPFMPLHPLPFRGSLLFLCSSKQSAAVLSLSKNSVDMWNATDENHLPISLRSTKKKKNRSGIGTIKDRLNFPAAINNNFFSSRRKLRDKK